MAGPEDYVRKKIKELEAKLAHWILIAEAAVFVAVTVIGLLLDYLLFGTVGTVDAALALIIAATAAFMTGAKLWSIYRDIMREAAGFINGQKKKS
ncbi:hypothetical protein AUJ14_02355 [Candidatus Micrarchaeota archaeon CG1_02_55_22]|nr:MAG: hypothetical protein AUJ14_02355 [Candidatus Micrarchaeota archaeon CG1_02_55_22]